MTPNNELNTNENNFNCETNNSNTLVIDVDKPVPKDPLKQQKNKIFKQVPIEENVEQFDAIESKNFFLRIKICFNHLDKIDKKISKPLQTYTPNFVVELIFFIFAKSFNTNTVIVYLISLLLYSIIKYKNIYIFLVVFFHVFIGALVTLLLKTIIGRSRPTLSVKRYFNNVRDKETSKSMPSGDSLQAANFAIMIILYFDSKLKYFVLLLIPASMSGRVFFNCHYWFDCIIGAILGFFISIFAYLVINKIKLYI